MTRIVIKQSEYDNVVSIPNAILKAFGLRVGSILDLSIVDCQIVLTPVVQKETLNSILTGWLPAKKTPTDL